MYKNGLNRHVVHVLQHQWLSAQPPQCMMIVGNTILVFEYMGQLSTILIVWVFFIIPGGPNGSFSFFGNQKIEGLLD